MSMSSPSPSACSRASRRKSPRRKLRLAARPALGVQGGAQELDVGDARNLDRILEAEEQAVRGALVRLHGEQILAVERHRALGHLIAGPAAEHVARVDLPEPFGPMIACTSPAFTARLMPFRIGLSATVAWRFSNFQHVSSWFRVKIESTGGGLMPIDPASTFSDRRGARLFPTAARWLQQSLPRFFAAIALIVLQSLPLTMPGGAGSRLPPATTGMSELRLAHHEGQDRRSDIVGISKLPTICAELCRRLRKHDRRVRVCQSVVSASPSRPPRAHPQARELGSRARTRPVAHSASTFSDIQASDVAVDARQPFETCASDIGGIEAGAHGPKCTAASIAIMP